MTTSVSHGWKLRVHVGALPLILALSLSPSWADANPGHRSPANESSASGADASSGGLDSAFTASRQLSCSARRELLHATLRAAFVPATQGVPSREAARADISSLNRELDILLSNRRLVAGLKGRADGPRILSLLEHMRAETDESADLLSDASLQARGRKVMGLYKDLSALFEKPKATRGNPYDNCWNSCQHMCFPDGVGGVVCQIRCWRCCASGGCT